ncbi:Wzz/FepE/Etk N-terminal domain-containing protein [Pseudoroseicyclus tamaricis]|uniref:Chain-length determining protein n=1 Tax=Pseudoroseicyclus tamaricis TaxID=2705421 RepID=A0A6B2JEW7_9RHOB|nr:Wzz/FepE/Etk N-terminal domain-containing protein [Pseudoroseicyclus tamaricis]NDU99472.1 chain-length determining protein [Pseudoroseicyclus tamaricis]
MSALLRFGFRVLRRHVWLILLVLLLGLPASLWFALSQDRAYQAIAVIQIEAPQINDAGTGATITADRQLELIEQKLMSRESLLSMIDEYGLYGPEVPRDQQVALLRQDARIEKILPAEAAFNPNVQPSGLNITVRMPTPELAATIANAFLDQIITEAEARNLSRAARTLEFFRTEEARVGAAIEAKEAELARFKEANSDSLPEAIEAQRTRLAQLQETQLELDSQIIELQTGADRIREEDLSRQTSLLQSQRDLVAETIAGIEAALAAAPEVERQLLAINRELEQLQTEYTAVTARRTEAALSNEIEAQDNASRFEVLERAEPPFYPVTASRKKLAIAGGAGSLVLAIGLAFLLELLSPTLRTAEQVERQLGVQPIVVIPVLTSRRARHRRWGTGLLALGGLALALWAAIRAFGGQLSGLLPFLGRSRTS